MDEATAIFESIQQTCSNQSNNSSAAVIVICRYTTLLFHLKSIIFEIKEVYHYLIVFKLLVLFHLGKKENINDVQESIATTTSMIGNLIQSQNSLKMLYHSTNQFFHLINKI